MKIKMTLLRVVRQYRFILGAVFCIVILLQINPYHKPLVIYKEQLPAEKIFVTKFVNKFVNKCSCKLLNILSPPIKNFEHFPCLKKINPSKDLAEHGKCVRTIKLPEHILGDHQGCVLMKFGRGTPICTYPVEEDVHVSNALVSRGYWEEYLVFPMLNIFQQRRNIALLDLGCNIGVYSLAAAQYSNKVFCLDANFENLYLVSKSLKQGHLQNNVTLIWNAISNKHKTVVLRKQLENVGGAEIDARNKSVTECDITVNTIILDDLKDIFVDQEVYMKLDVQSEEHHVLRNGREFFKTAKVLYVQLEYVMHIGLSSGREIINIMKEYGYDAYNECEGLKKLDPADELEWPNDVCFLPALPLF